MKPGEQSFRAHRRETGKDLSRTCALIVAAKAARGRKAARSATAAMTALVEPFSYGYMVNAIWVSGLVGCVCGFLSAFLMLKGWSLIGDALSHAIVPGVAGAYMLGLPFAAGAFLAGLLAAAAILALQSVTRLKHDAVIGLIFTSFFGLGLFMVSLSPTSVNVPDHRHGQHPRGDARPTRRSSRSSPA